MWAIDLDGVSKWSGGWNPNIEQYDVYVHESDLSEIPVDTQLIDGGYIYNVWLEKLTYLPSEEKYHAVYRKFKNGDVK